MGKKVEWNLMQRNLRKEWGIFPGKKRVEDETKERTYCGKKSVHPKIGTKSKCVLIGKSEGRILRSLLAFGFRSIGILVSCVFL